MSPKDIRWIQRLSNFSKALNQLEKAVQIAKDRNLTDLEKQGLIQAFEFTHELAWNVMKDYFIHQGASELITGSRDSTRTAFNRGIISQGEIWMEMIQSRNKTSHTYDLNIADDIANKILDSYFESFKAFHHKMTEISLNELK